MRAVFPALVFSLALLHACTTSSFPDPAPRPAGAGEPAGNCTSIMVGRLASTDGSVITSHTCDGNYRTWVEVVPARQHEEGAEAVVRKGTMHTEFPSDRRGVEEMGRIPQVAATHAYLNTAYPAMNEHQLAIGESTFGGRRELRSKEGLFHVEELQRLALQRCRTARDAVQLMGRLACEHGYVDGGEALTVADPEEVWHMEILGPGKGRKGALWAAVRIPDDHVGVAANVCRIGTLDLERPDRFLASPNVISLAEEKGWWDPEEGRPFSFWRAYGGTKKAFKVREFWVLSRLAPSLGLDFDEAEELPLSVKPERKVSVRDIFAFFRGTYQGSRFELTRKLEVKDRRSGKMVTSSYVHPWLARGRQRLLNTLEEGVIDFQRPIPVMFNAYHTIIQCRGWLPDPIGGICWLGFDNPGITPRAPLFCGIRELPADFRVDNQHRFRRDSAAWAFRRAARLACIRWGATRERVARRLQRWEEKAFAELPGVERKALELHREDPEKARRFLTDYSLDFCRAMTRDYWQFGDELWLQHRFRM